MHKRIQHDTFNFVLNMQIVTFLNNICHYGSPSKTFTNKEEE